MRDAGRMGRPRVAFAALFALVAACATSGPTQVAQADPEQACAGVAMGERATGIEGLEISRAEALERRYPLGGFVAEGVGLHVPLRGRTLGAFETVMKCRVARSKAAGGPGDPLAVRGARLRVLRGAEDEAIVHLRSRNIDTAKEITKRFRAIMDVADLREEFGEDPWTAPPRSPAGTGQGPGASLPGLPARP